MRRETPTGRGSASAPRTSAERRSIEPMAWWEWVLVFVGLVATIVFIYRFVDRHRDETWWWP
jgi:hypothetical protein